MDATGRKIRPDMEQQIHSTFRVLGPWSALMHPYSVLCTPPTDDDSGEWIQCSDQQAPVPEMTGVGILELGIERTSFHLSRPGPTEYMYMYCIA